MTRTALTPGDRSTLGSSDRQALASGDRQSLTLGDRIPTWMPVAPSVWIDGTLETANDSAPAAGNGDEQPTNIPTPSSATLTNATASEQPIWQDGYWEFGGDDYWVINGMPMDPDELFLMAALESNGGGIIYGHLGGTSSVIQLNIRQSQNDIRLRSQNEAGNNSTLDLNSIDYSGVGVVALRWSSSGTAKLWWLDANDDTSQSGAVSAGNYFTNETQFGAVAGISNFTGNVYGGVIANATPPDAYVSGAMQSLLARYV